MPWQLVVVTLVASLAPSPPTEVVQRGCEVGERPGYFVPGPDAGEPIAVVGCARLGISGKPVELSANVERTLGRRYLWVNPAYRGRGRPGIYIPAVGVREPAPDELDPIDVRIPTQAVRRYRLVIWGFTAPGTRRVEARHLLGHTRAAVFNVGSRVASAAGAPRPFALFLVELPHEAACGWIQLEAAAERERLRPRPRWCDGRS